jgi:hypothetical protein
MYVYVGIVNGSRNDSSLEIVICGLKNKSVRDKELGSAAG